MRINSSDGNCWGLCDVWRTDVKSRIYPEKSRIITTCSAVNGHIALVLLLFFVLFFIDKTHTFWLAAFISITIKLSANLPKIFRKMGIGQRKNLQLLVCFPSMHLF